MGKVLIVDDAAFMRLRVANLLKGKDYTVIEASNGQEAIQKYLEEKPDVVLLDITMPVMDGLTALKEIISLDPKAKIVMCSALGQESIVIEAIKNGARDFVVKPFQPDKILAAVGRFALQG
ncbi:MAG: response regulator [Firmicutes bacterium]|nr:response regulator [Bacillota bacterium]